MPKQLLISLHGSSYTNSCIVSASHNQLQKHVYTFTEAGYVLVHAWGCPVVESVWNCGIHLGDSNSIPDINTFINIPFKFIHPSAIFQNHSNSNISIPMPWYATLSVHKYMLCSIGRWNIEWHVSKCVVCVRQRVPWPDSAMFSVSVQSGSSKCVHNDSFATPGCEERFLTFMYFYYNYFQSWSAFCSLRRSRGKRFCICCNTYHSVNKTLRNVWQRYSECCSSCPQLWLVYTVH